MKYGLTDDELKRLREVFIRNRRIEQVILYGSRAKGNYKPFSDIDITLVGPELTLDDLRTVAMTIDDLLLPYETDVSLFDGLKNEALKDHIRRVGILLYERGIG